MLLHFVLSTCSFTPHVTRLFQSHSRALCGSESETSEFGDSASEPSDAQCQPGQTGRQAVRVQAAAHLGWEHRWQASFGLWRDMPATPSWIVWRETHTPNKSGQVRPSDNSQTLQFCRLKSHDTRGARKSGDAPDLALTSGDSLAAAGGT